MPVQNIECQLAQGQIARYLSGDSFPTAVVTELEKHIAECEHCQEIVAQKKAMLQAMMRLQDAKPAKAVIQIAEEEEEEEPETVVEEAPKAKAKEKAKPSRQSLSQKLIERIAEAHETQSSKAETVREPADKKKIFGKPLVYSVALAALMVGMSYVMKDPTRLFGDRVLSSEATAAPAAVAPIADASATDAPEASQEVLDSAAESIGTALGDAIAAASATAKLPEPAAEEQTPASTPENANTAPANAEPAKTEPASTQPANTQPTKKPAASAPRRQPNRTQPRTSSSSGIRVYDKDGNPIK